MVRSKSRNPGLLEALDVAIEKRNFVDDRRDQKSGRARPLKQTPKIGRPDLDDDAVAEFDAVPSSCFGPCRRSAFDRSMQSILNGKAPKDLERDVGTKRSHVWRHFPRLRDVEPIPVDDVSGDLDRMCRMASALVSRPPG